MARSITTLLTAPAAAAQPAVPGYRLQEIIGQGGMGVVHRAVRLEDGLEVAVKLLPAHFADDEEIAGRFAREAQALTALDHPHILRVLDSGITPEGRLFLVTAFAAGGDLAARLQRGPLPPEEAAPVFRGILEGLQEAHRQGILHRDIKPANILLDAGGRAQVGDFSLAKRLPGEASPALTLTRNSGVFGTPYYIPPEVRRGQDPVDGRSDIYSLGVLLHEMFTGHLPLGNYEPASHHARVGKGMNQLISACLREDPGKRPATIGAVRKQFEAALKPPFPWRPVTAILLPAAGILCWALFRPAPPRVTPLTASLAQPWVNSLGMSFVPVVGTRTLFSIWETRQGDFSAFAKDHPGNSNERGWQQSGTGQDPLSPVTSVSWLRAQQFCDWLNTTEHASHLLPMEMIYRLPRDAEWSAAAGLEPEAGETPEARSGGLGPMEHAPYPWGRFWPPPATGFPANFAGAETGSPAPAPGNPLLFRDGWPRTAPVGSFQPNALGLFDLAGNVSEWCLDDWSKNSPDKTLRGGAYHQSTASALRLDTREHLKPTRQLPTVGFRVVIDKGT
jgi:hypothetical protein